MNYVRNSKRKMNKKKLILSIILSVVALAILTICILFLTNAFESKSDGSITVELVELDGSKKATKEIEFSKGDTLIELLDENFDNVVVENGMLQSIDTFANALDWSSYISILVDGEYSMVGVLEIEFTDGTIITFKMEEYIPYTS